MGKELVMSQNEPPSMERKVDGIALAIVGLEYFGLWPEWATMERQRGVRLPRP